MNRLKKYIGKMARFAEEKHPISISRRDLTQNEDMVLTKLSRS